MPRRTGPPDGDGRAASDDGRLFLPRHAADEAADVVSDVARHPAARGVGGLEACLLEAQQVERPARPHALFAQALFEVAREAERVAEVLRVAVVVAGRGVAAEVRVEAFGQDAPCERNEFADPEQALVEQRVGERVELRGRERAMPSLAASAKTRGSPERSPGKERAQLGPCRGCQ